MVKVTRKNVAMLIQPVDDNESLFAIAQKDGSTLCEASDEVTIISGFIPPNIIWPENCSLVDFEMKLHYVKYMSPKWWAILFQIYKIIYIQIRMAFEIAKRSKDLDIVLCYLGYHYQIPILVAKLLGKKVITGAWGIAVESEENYGKFFGNILRFFLDFMYFFSDVVIIQSWIIADHPYLIRWNSKMRLGAQYFGDSKIFNSTIPFSERDDVVGFVGRFVHGKGILEFINAIPLVLLKNSNIKFVIIGRGFLNDEVRRLVTDFDLNEHVTLVGQIDNQELPAYYNQFKLIVIPSTSEGLPNVMLEAASSKTSVLSMPVGAIPDVIVEGESGFLLETNSSEEIAKRILELFNDQTLMEKTALKANQIVQTNYSYEAAADRFKIVINELCQT